MLRAAPGTNPLHRIWSRFSRRIEDAKLRFLPRRTGRSTRQDRLHPVYQRQRLEIPARCDRTNQDPRPGGQGGGQRQNPPV